MRVSDTGTASSSETCTTWNGGRLTPRAYPPQ
jgi:hypothetical protein